MIVKRGESIGVDWQGTMAQLKQQDWDAALREVENPAVVTPQYYQQPFHAYKQVCAASPDQMMPAQRMACNHILLVECACGFGDLLLEFAL